MKARKFYSIDQSPLFKLGSRRRLAQRVFDVELSFLEELANNDSNYRVFHITQGVKKRQVEAPKPILERLHRRLFVLLERVDKPDYLQSGVKGRSYITNAQLHVGHVPLAKLDIQKFYPSVGAGRVYRFFHQAMLCSPDVSALLTKLCTFDGHVPTGSCLSQLLAYFATKDMFDELHQLALARAVRYTCYVDDLTFSGTGATPALLWEAKRVMHAHGFKYHKDRCYLADQEKIVTGVMVDGDRIAILPSKEHEIWRRTNALGGHDPSERKAAVERLIGSVVAAGQVEARLLRRLRRLRELQRNLKSVNVVA